MRLDVKDKFPSGMEEYLAFNGWHFNKKMCDWAVSKMRVSDGGPLKHIYTAESVETLFEKCGITLKNQFDYDCVYVANMARADFYGSSLADEIKLAKFIKDFMDDPDGYEEIAFTRFYADCIGKGIAIPWEDML